MGHQSGLALVEGFAARGGVDGQEFAWGDELLPDGKAMANFWQGNFPSENLLIDGYERTSPVGSFPANGYGLSDMIGNVWEWTEDFYAARHQADPSRPCCAPGSSKRWAPRTTQRCIITRVSSAWNWMPQALSP